MKIEKIKEVKMYKGEGSPLAQIQLIVEPFGIENTLNDIFRLIKKTNPSELEFEIKKKTKRRSNSSNAYMWIILDKTAKKLGTDKNALYIKAIIEAGVFEDISVPKDKENVTIAEHAAQGFGFVAIKIGEDRVNSNNVIIRKFKGSSQYNNEEMHRLVSYIVEGAKECGIDVLPPKKVMELDK